ncbi:MAG TPA: DUF3048 domain-containing protein [Candidatus Saccharimonadales bacterium]|nr:DUF3048 domain-containing protein [Candidatus Saccharimonadales bacterium]
MNQETKKIPLRRRLCTWMRAHTTKTYLIIGAGLILIASGIAFVVVSQTPIKSTYIPIKPDPKPEPPKEYYSPLTGIPVKNEAATKQAVTAIMLENSPDARPQSGLKQSGVVYEAIAEGGITRFLALYQQEKPKLIGPVRSLRMYYVDWLAPYNASVAHVGGSAAALTEIRKSTYRDIDQFFNPGTYWRATDRYAPHNVYTNFAKIDALNKAKGYTKSTFDGFPRVDGKVSKTPKATSITINVSSPTYNSTYKYSKKKNHYARSQGGAPHLDREKGQITPSVVIALKVNMQRVMQDGYREKITTSGKGEAIIFQNGTAKTVTWRKANRKSQLHFTDKSGEEVSLVRGQTWITAVPNGSGSVSWR